MWNNCSEAIILACLLSDLLRSSLEFAYKSKYFHVRRTLNSTQNNKWLFHTSLKIKKSSVEIYVEKGTSKIIFSLNIKQLKLKKQKKINIKQRENARMKYYISNEHADEMTVSQLLQNYWWCSEPTLIYKTRNNSSERQASKQSTQIVFNRSKVKRIYVHVQRSVILFQLEYVETKKVWEKTISLVDSWIGLKNLISNTVLDVRLSFSY